MKTKEIVLKTGVAIVPEEFMVIEETRTDNADYAGVIAEKQGTIPHYVVFSEKPISAITAMEEERLYDKCSKIYPEIGQVLAKE